jgi:hypothetical protein
MIVYGHVCVLQSTTPPPAPAAWTFPRSPNATLSAAPLFLLRSAIFVYGVVRVAQTTTPSSPVAARVFLFGLNTTLPRIYGGWKPRGGSIFV